MTQYLVEGCKKRRNSHSYFITSYGNVWNTETEVGFDQSARILGLGVTGVLFPSVTLRS